MPEFKIVDITQALNIVLTATTRQLKIIEKCVKEEFDMCEGEDKIELARTLGVITELKKFLKGIA